MVTRHFPARTAPRVALVLGGGGMKGFAHIGVLRALEERGIRPTVYAGTSIGALIAAAAVGGMAIDEMARRAISLRRRDVFRLNHFGMLMERMRSPSIYLEEPLRELCRATAPPKRFSELDTTLLINTVDLERGTQTVWGLPGLQDAFVMDAVYASCALPGYFPPGLVAGRTCVDGGVIDNLPVEVAAVHADVVVAVDVGSNDMQPASGISELGFAAIYMRAASTMMRALQQAPLAHWSGPPMILMRPRVGDEWMNFENTERNIELGYEAARDALGDFDRCLEEAGGIHPRRRMTIDVRREACIGCGLCAALAPRLMGMDATGKAFARMRNVEWSAADGDFVHHCPSQAIDVHEATTEMPIPSITPVTPAPVVEPLRGTGTD